jgi:hypothetical protein
LAFDVNRLGKIGKWIWSNTDPLTKWLQILAFALAGYWTLTIFVLSESPSLEPRASARIDVEVRYQGDACYVDLNIDVHNSGKRSFDVAMVRIQGWQSELPVPQGWQTYVDVEKLEVGKPLIEKILDHNNPGHLVAHYVPDAHWIQSFRWVVGTLTPKEYVFKVEVLDCVGCDHKPLAYGRALRESLCHEDPPKQFSPPA